MPKIKKTPYTLFRVKSKVNSDFYYTSKDFPEKVIDGKVFIGVKKTPTDKTLHYMLKENMEKVRNNL
jgi:hypothetical protein